MALSYFSKVLLVYGQFLLVTGLAGWAMAGWTGKAKHGAMMGLGGDIAMCGLAFMASSDKDKPRARMVEFQAMILPIVLGAVFVWQAKKQLGDPTKQDRLYLFILMALGSFCTSFLLISTWVKADTHQDEKKDKKSQ
eukprot:m.50942 g.50942  ORF g.50942 m.50942 type:complete len:137 (-) comp10694_c0_seq1:2557-2967(-)